jgi:acyl carrier protein
VNDTEEKIRTFIIEELGFDGDRAAFTSDTKLLDENVLDSLGVYELVTYLEGQYGIEVMDEEMVPENFGTITSLVALVETKRAG